MTRIGYCCMAAAGLMLAALNSAQAQHHHQEHCGCGYTNAQASALWAGYCQEGCGNNNCGRHMCGLCGKRGCGGRCRDACGCNNNCFGWPGGNQCCGNQCCGQNNCGQACGGCRIGCRKPLARRCFDDACGFANRVHSDMACGIKQCGRRIEKSMCDLDFRPTCGHCGHRYFGMGCHHCGHHGHSLKLFSGVRGCGQCDLGCGNDCGCGQSCGGCQQGCGNNNCFGWNNNNASCCGRSYFHRDYHFVGNFCRRMHSWYGCGNDCNGCGQGDYGYGYSSSNGCGGCNGNQGTPHPAHDYPSAVEPSPANGSGNVAPGPDQSGQYQGFAPRSIQSTNYPTPATVIPRSHDNGNTGRSINDYNNSSLNGYIN